MPAPTAHSPDFVTIRAAPFSESCSWCATSAMLAAQRKSNGIFANVQCASSLAG